MDGYLQNITNESGAITATAKPQGKFKSMIKFCYLVLNDVNSCDVRVHQTQTYRFGDLFLRKRLIYNIGKVIMIASCFLAETRVSRHILTYRSRLEGSAQVEVT